MLPRQKIRLAIIIVINAVLWWIPSDVVELVARDRHTLLGRYSREHFTLNVLVAVVSLIALYIARGRGEAHRKRLFQVIAVLMAGTPVILAADFSVRLFRPPSYVRKTPAYRRPANITFTETFVDRPEAARSYPHARDGFGEVTCDYHTDANGYRNETLRTKYDVVALGDSFTEGSKVSDADSWPAVLARRSGLAVYNQGMSGYSPVHYLASFEEVGAGLSPGYVVCVLYEGNDFRSKRGDDKPTDSVSRRLKRYFKQSPFRRALDGFFVSTFGPIGADWDAPGLEKLAWLPVGVPPGEGAKYYAFAPKQLLQNIKPVQVFAKSAAWENTAVSLAKLNDACARAGVKLVVSLAPSKAHVIFPLVADGLPADDVRDFAALRSDDLPPGDEFVARVLRFLPSAETVTARWCAENGVPFISLTGPLRRRAAGGEQVYYAYDQHWTPIGHAIAAETIGAWLARDTEEETAAAFAPTE